MPAAQGQMCKHAFGWARIKHENIYEQDCM